VSFALGLLYREYCAAARICGSEKNSSSNYHVSGEGLPQNWMILLGHRMLQYIGDEPLRMAGTPNGMGDLHVRFFQGFRPAGVSPAQACVVDVTTNGLCTMFS
jgi:hypothetical protein